MIVNIVLITFGLFLILGGFFGFKKGSKVSLIMGLVSGVLILGGVVILNVLSQVYAVWIYLTCLNLLLSIVFLMRLIKTRVFMPSGMLLLTTLGVLIFCLFHLLANYA